MEQESAATKVAVEEAISDLEALDAERTDLRKKLQVAPFFPHHFQGSQVLVTRGGALHLFVNGQQSESAKAHKHRTPSESTAQTCY
jgi:hypothetical protein